MGGNPTGILPVKNDTILGGNGYNPNELRSDVRADGGRKEVCYFPSTSPPLLSVHIPAAKVSQILNFLKCHCAVGFLHLFASVLGVCRGFVLMRGPKSIVPMNL